MPNCNKCKTPFEITNDDLTFYKKIDVTQPTLCPDCRQQRRLAWRNLRSLYKRECDLCKKPIVSIYSPNSPYTVYCSKCWWSEDWDPMNYGKEFDFSQPFFKQWNELNIKTPKLTLINDNNSQSVNCEYTNDFESGKNCYMVFGSWQQEFCMYSQHANRTNTSSDVLYCYDSELLYECVDCERCNNSMYIINSENCRDCFFSYDLQNCSDCILCHGLRGKQYYIRNKAYSKQDYEKYVNELSMYSYKNIQKLREELMELLPTIPRKNLNQKNCQDSIGDHLVNCKNIYIGFDLLSGEDSKYIYLGDTIKDSYDICFAGKTELCYDSLTCDNSYHSRFTVFSWQNRFITYANDCHFCENVFGCVSLRKGKYCILNKQYSKEEYEELVPKIIEHMQKYGEWSEFFPINFSPFAYNETVAYEHYPLTQEEVLAKGWKWKEKNSDIPQSDNVILAENLPDTIGEVTDEILGKAIKCSSSDLLFRIVPQELEFYRKQNIPLPRLHPDERHKIRIQLRNPYKIFNRNCYSCHQEIQTTYAPNRPEKVLCESCYLKEIY